MAANASNRSQDTSLKHFSTRGLPRAAGTTRTYWGRIAVP
jgi:hypothetical protein